MSQYNFLKIFSCKFKVYKEKITFSLSIIKFTVIYNIIDIYKKVVFLKTKHSCSAVVHLIILGIIKFTTCGSQAT